MLFVNDVRDAIQSSTVSTIIGSKAIFTPLGLLEFFTTINKFVARVFIWRSMKKSTIEEIVDYLFHGSPPPFEILRQDCCRKIETSQKKYLKVIGGLKDIFLENLS